ncbi:membrane transporter [Coprinopsis cinerea okayama7|uniref:Membrane transporter n=1 Tax=Coprinopsis cinerea (strain Okayama-7 / 130 / ATCC MYA-4618 / FGSC 9003) TaxID=240176 RepID=A8NEZ4_COPC7|nr:membrane transporter [Coprinopsis cinerea okayama7\|eukprot:XP_001833171.2 membrane transporter [Coprinopsis cinerea okayama7\
MPSLQRRKIDWHIMPLMCILYLMAFADKATLGQSAVLGIIPDAHLTQSQFNWLGTVFYFSYLLFEYPQNLALQRFPVGKWMSINIFVWAIALMAHAACKSFATLFVVRFILGACEGAITPGFMIVTSMFYTREEQTRRVGYWFLMNGTAIIVLGLVGFGVLHIKTPSFAPWQWLMMITGLVTLVTSVLFWFFFPDSPTSAWFLTQEERSLAVQRISANQSGIENKKWKKDQFLEAFRDPKIWVMALFAAIVQVPNSLANQRQIIVHQFGFSTLKTTLLGCVDGLVEIIYIWAGVAIASIPAVGRGHAAALISIPALVGSLLVNALPSENQVGLLFSYWVSIFFIVPFPLFLGWVGSIVSGHTKKTTANAIILIAYAIGNAAGPFMWRKHYQPRNHVPWAIISACIVSGAFLMVVLRTMLVRENRRRDKEPRDETYDDVCVVKETEDGKKIEQKIDKAFLDLTDIQNRDFRYIL